MGFTCQRPTFHITKCGGPITDVLLEPINVSRTLTCTWVCLLISLLNDTQVGWKHIGRISKRSRYILSQCAENISFFLSNMFFKKKLR